MMMQTRTLGKACADIITLMLDRRLKHATKFLTSQYTVKATHRGTWDGRDSRNEILVTVGRPNHAERRFIRLAKKAGEPFPIKKIQVK